MKNKKPFMRIAELTKRSRISIPRIKYYIGVGIVPKPIKSGKTTAYYTSQHLERLLLIKKLRDEKNVSISEIRQMVGKEPDLQDVSGDKNTAITMVKNDIINSCIPIFRKKGYEKTTTEDIINAANITRYYFYKHFKNKKELFIECLNTIKEKFEKASIFEKNFELTHRKRAIAFYDVFPEWRDMMILFAAASLKYPKDFAERYEQTLYSRIKLTIDTIEKAQQDGEIRQVNSELIGVMIHGASHFILHQIYRGRFKNEPLEIFNELLDVWMEGLKKR